MKIISNGDSYADALSTSAIATIPFIAIGSLEHPAVYYTSWTLCFLFACIYIARLVIILRKDSSKRSERVENLVEIMQVPYVFALAACFFMQAGYDMKPVFGVTLGVALIGAALVLFNKKDF